MLPSFISTLRSLFLSLAPGGNAKFKKPSLLGKPCASLLRIFQASLLCTNAQE